METAHCTLRAIRCSDHIYVCMTSKRWLAMQRMCFSCELNSVVTRCRADTRSRCRTSSCRASVLSLYGHLPELNQGTYIMEGACARTCAACQITAAGLVDDRTRAYIASERARVLLQGSSCARSTSTRVQRLLVTNYQGPSSVTTTRMVTKASSRSATCTCAAALAKLVVHVYA